MDRRKVLFVLHNHPTLHPGGAEAYALELYEALRTSDEFDPVLVARIGPNIAMTRPSHLGTPFSVVNGDPNQYFVFTETDHFDFFLMSYRDKSLYTRHFADLLIAHRPDVVHFQHTLFIGFDLITQTHMTLPDVPIVYTLHEYLPICHRDGQMVRTQGDQLCLESSPRRCNECFPSISPQDFFLRKRFIQSHLAHVDRFVAPSKFLFRRYVDWGIPAEKIQVEDYGRLPLEPVFESPGDRRRTRIGFFGQLNQFKGVNVLLRAMRILIEDEPDAHLWLHGANLELQSRSVQEEFRGLLDQVKDHVTFAGPYNHEDLPKLIGNVDWVVVPSVWWENSPLVIQEAFSLGRPVICSDIGAMAEKVTDGVDGLHFRVGDAMGLGQTLRRAIATPDLWEKLRSGIHKPHSMNQHANTLMQMYRDLLQERARI
jgi:glycosyltransferase involved in cell wall biosynthesis